MASIFLCLFCHLIQTSVLAILQLTAIKGYPNKICFYEGVRKQIHPKTYTNFGKNFGRVSKT